MIKRICDICGKEVTERFCAPLKGEWLGGTYYDMCGTCHRKYVKTKEKAEKEAIKAFLKSKGLIDIPEDEV